MSQMSEEQKKELKFKLVLLAILVVVGGFGLAIGPGLPVIVNKARKANTDPKSPEKFYTAAKIMEMTFRVPQAEKLYQEYWLLYADDGPENDLEWSKVGLESPFWDKELDGLPIDSYMPWKVEYEMDNERPPPVRSGTNEKKYLGKVLVALGEIWWEKREYLKADHIFACLVAFWPDGSEEKEIAKKYVVRKKARSF